MSIKSDRWIRRMATRARHDRAVRRRRSGRSTRRARSSPTASRAYGYDMRVAPRVQDLHQRAERRSSIRRTSTRSFVEFEGDVCIVPPNSFALARSVEYFRIPRNVLTICVGK